MYELGLKLWSINKCYSESILDLFKKSLFHYIELFAYPDTYSSCIDYWKGIYNTLNIPFIIHAAHSAVGLNPSNSSMFYDNVKLVDEAKRYANSLNAVNIILHPGVNGTEEETARQINFFNDKRILIENKPFYALNAKDICNGWSPEKINYIIKETNCGFCFDIGHSIYAANVINKNKISFIKSFLDLNPNMIHLSDGDYFSTVDMHVNLNKGNFPLKDIIKHIPKNKKITLETDKKSNNSLDDFIEDINTFWYFV